MKISVISFTQNGIALSKRLKEKMPRADITLFSKCKSAAKADGLSALEESLGEWTKAQMEQKNALVFIGACGIAVRAIAPWIVDKLQDSPVLVMDELGKHVIPILSGHMGGANELAVSIARACSAEAVITTATDLNRKFAADLFAKKNSLWVANKEGIARVSAKVLAGEPITISIEKGHFPEKSKCPAGLYLTQYPPEGPVDILVSSKKENVDALLWLKPREYVIGIGCRKGKEEESAAAFLRQTLHRQGLSMDQIYALSSIDIKKEEAAFLSFSRKEKLPFYTYSAQQLLSVEGDFAESSFVKEKTGVGNVCERAAMMACGPGGELILQKTAEDGMTIAIAKRKWSVTFDET